MIVIVVDLLVAMVAVSAMVLCVVVLTVEGLMVLLFVEISVLGLHL